MRAIPLALGKQGEQSDLLPPMHQDGGLLEAGAVKRHPGRRKPANRRNPGESPTGAEKPEPRSLACKTATTANILLPFLVLGFGLISNRH